MSNYSAGHSAEKQAANYLKSLGFSLEQLNWQTKYCEIDIVAEKHKIKYFIEVKSRANTFQGSGLDYITDKKLKQMTFAAQFWVHENKWEGEYQLAVVAIDGTHMTFIDDIILEI